MYSDLLFKESNQGACFEAERKKSVEKEVGERMKQHSGGGNGAKTGEDAVQAQWDLLPLRPGQGGGRFGRNWFPGCLASRA